ncbi:hypothetical protein MMC30_008429 [Trapelia coarctata]|nr:hypothetical protein [Trapelia coarctata]
MKSKSVEENAGNNILKRLIEAAGNGELDVVQDILAEWQAMPDPVPERGDNARPMYYLHPALEAAVYSNHLHVVSYLLDHHFRCDGPAVTAAVRFSSIGSLELFFAMHAKTPLTYAALRGSLNTVKILFEHGGDTRCGSLLYAVVRGKKPGRLAILDYLLDKGTPIDGLEYEENYRAFQTWSPRGLGTPLHAAVKAESEVMVAALLGNGADRNIKDTLGRTPLDRAETWELTNIVELLKDG